MYATYNFLVVFSFNLFLFFFDGWELCYAWYTHTHIAISYLILTKSHTKMPGQCTWATTITARSYAYDQYSVRIFLVFGKRVYFDTHSLNAQRFDFWLSFSHRSAHKSKIKFILRRYVRRARKHYIQANRRNERKMLHAQPILVDLTMERV